MFPSPPGPVAFIGDRETGRAPAFLEERSAPCFTGGGVSNNHSPFQTAYQRGLKSYESKPLSCHPAPREMSFSIKPAWPTPQPIWTIGPTPPASSHQNRMLLVILMGMIGLVVLIETAIVAIHFDLHGRLRRQPEK